MFKINSLFSFVAENFCIIPTCTSIYFNTRIENIVIKLVRKFPNHEALIKIWTGNVYSASPALCKCTSESLDFFEIYQ